MTSIERGTDGVNVHIEHLGEFLDEECLPRVPGGVTLRAEIRLDVSEFLGCRRRHDLPAIAANRFMPRDITSTPRTGDGRDTDGFVALSNLHPVDARELSVGITTEHRDVTGRGAGASNPAVVILDMRLVEVPGREERRTGLPEVRQRDRPRDTGTVSSLPVDVQQHPVAQVVNCVELRPQRRVAIRPVSRMVLQPIVQIRHRRDERDGAPTLFTLHGRLQPVFVILDVAEGEGFEFAATEPSVKLDSDHRRVTRVVRRVDHREDVLVPVQHLAGVRRRIILGGCPSLHPIERRRHVVAVRFDVLASFGEAFPEDTECGTVVPIRLLVVVLPVDPLHDRLRGVFVLECGGELAVALGDPDARPEELPVPEVGVRLCEEVEAVAELEERLAIGFTDGVGVAGSLAEVLDVLTDVLTHAYQGGTPNHLSRYAVDMNLSLETHPWLQSLGSEPLRSDNAASANTDRRGIGCKAHQSQGGLAA